MPVSLVLPRIAPPEASSHALKTVRLSLGRKLSGNVEYQRQDEVYPTDPAIGTPSAPLSALRIPSHKPDAWTTVGSVGVINDAEAVPPIDCNIPLGAS